MEEKELTCIGCPMGCTLQGKLAEGAVTEVTGNICSRGSAYAKKEVSNPPRTVTSTVRVEGGCFPVAPVRTKADIPKGKIFEVMDALKKVRLPAPVSAGDVALQNAAGTGVDVVVTKEVRRSQAVEKPA